MVGIVEEIGSAVRNVVPGDRVTVNVETFCGECFFCKKGFVNNCTDKNGGWALARPNAIVTIVALYDKPMALPLPNMYGKNLVFKTGDVDGCDCEEILSLIEL